MPASIELWGASWCEACQKAKDHVLSTSPQSKGVLYSYRDMSDAGVNVPQLHVIYQNGSADSVSGYDAGRYSSILDRLYSQSEPKPAPAPATKAPEPPRDPAPIEQPAAQFDVSTVIVMAAFASLGYLGYRNMGG